MASPPEFIVSFSKLTQLHTEEIRLAKRNEHADNLCNKLDFLIYNLCGLSEKHKNLKHATTRILLSLGYNRCWYKSVQERLYAITWLSVISNMWGRKLSADIFKTCRTFESISNLWCESLLVMKPPLRMSDSLTTIHDGNSASNSVTALYGRIGKKLKILRNLDNTRCRILSKIGAKLSAISDSGGGAQGVTGGHILPVKATFITDVYDKLLGYGSALIMPSEVSGSQMSDSNKSSSGGGGRRRNAGQHEHDVKGLSVEELSPQRELENEVRRYENEVRRVAAQDTADRLKYLEWISKSILVPNKVNAADKCGSDDESEEEVIRRRLEAAQLSDEAAYKKQVIKQHESHCLAYQDANEDRTELVCEADKLRNALRSEIERSMSIIATLEGAVTELMMCGRIQAMKVPVVQTQRPVRPHQPFTYRSEDWEDEVCDPEESNEKGSEVGGVQYLKWCADEDVRKCSRSVADLGHQVGSWRDTEKKSEVHESVLEKGRELLVKRQLDLQEALEKEVGACITQSSPSVSARIRKQKTQSSPQSSSHSGNDGSDSCVASRAAMTPWFTETDHIRAINIGMITDYTRNNPRQQPDSSSATPILPVDDHSRQMQGRGKVVFSQQQPSVSASAVAIVQNDLCVRDVATALDGLRGHHIGMLERTAKATAKYCPYEFVYCDSSAHDVASSVIDAKAGRKANG
jgi:hypothetical protein